MSDKINLHPCPFCGEALQINQRKHNPFARCATAGCVGGKLPLLNIELAEDVEAWNRRAAVAQQPAAAVPCIPAQWGKSLSHCWPEDADDRDGDWCIGTTDEDGNRYEVVRVEASLYDAWGESQGIAEAIVNLWAYAADKQAPRELFTCIDKGGRYELLGESSGAGGCRREGRVIYRCLDTGQLYHRTDDDFAARMAPLNEEGKA